MPSSHSDAAPRGDQPDNDRGWTDDGHTIIPTVELEAIGVRIVCPGPDRCRAKYGCDRCSAGGYIYDDGEEKPCPICDEDGIDPGRADRCWLSETAGYDCTVAEMCRNAEMVDALAGHEIVWRDPGSWDDPQPEWKSKGVESYDARVVRKRNEHLAEMETRRAV